MFEYAQCEAYLRQGAALNVAEFMSWFGARKEGEWLKEKDNNGNTLLLYALIYKVPEAVAMTLFEAWPDAVNEQSHQGATPLYLALQNNAPEAVVVGLRLPRRGRRTLSSTRSRAVAIGASIGT